jgi:hypothetical protein
MPARLTACSLFACVASRVLQLSLLFLMPSGSQTTAETKKPNDLENEPVWRMILASVNLTRMSTMLVFRCRRRSKHFVCTGNRPSTTCPPLLCVYLLMGSRAVADDQILAFDGGWWRFPRRGWWMFYCYSDVSG